MAWIEWNGRKSNIFDQVISFEQKDALLKMTTFRLIFAFGNFLGAARELEHAVGGKFRSGESD